MVREFQIIREYFAPLAGGEGLGLTDDAACLSPPEGQDLVITKDMIVEGIHFRPDDPPDTVAQKAVGVNYSDLAGKGATPLVYFVGLALPKGRADTWIPRFAEGLKAAQMRHGGRLAGGDTTRTDGPLIISLTAVGCVPHGEMVKRSGAAAGDDIWVTGTLGEAALGLMMLEGDLSPLRTGCVERYRIPHPRLDFVSTLRTCASAAADISDGLIADLGHICAASGKQAVIERARLPVSVEVQTCLQVRPDLWPTVYTGGDDYELVFTSPVSARARLEAAGESGGPGLARIGSVTDRANGHEFVKILDETGTGLSSSSGGYAHDLD